MKHYFAHLVSTARLRHQSGKQESEAYRRFLASLPPDVRREYERAKEQARKQLTR